MTIPSCFLFVFSPIFLYIRERRERSEREEREKREERTHFSFFRFLWAPVPLFGLHDQSLVFLFFEKVCPKKQIKFGGIFPKASLHITNTNTQHINNHVLYSQLLYRPRQRHHREIQLEGTSQKYRASCFFHTCQRALVKFFSSAREIGRRGMKISWRSPAEIA